MAALSPLQRAAVARTIPHTQIWQTAPRTENEFKTRQNSPNYFNYRVFEFKVETNLGKLYIISPQDKLDNYFTIETKVYKITPNKMPK